MTDLQKRHTKPCSHDAKRDDGGQPKGVRRLGKDRVTSISQVVTTAKAKDRVVTTLRAGAPLREWLARNVG